jgi:uncharacterized membrane protein YdjX (TVP38/TMEM64 family)
VKYLVLLATALAAAFAAAFVLAEVADIPLLTDPSSYLGGRLYAAAAIGVGLLAADVVLPVPSSVLMTVHGALFGVAVGAALSLVGSLGAAAIGYGIGRAGSPLLERIVIRDQRQNADRIVQRWGGLAVALTRPVPIVAETVAVIAGTSSLGWGRLLGMAALGSLPPSLFYAFLGAHA